MFCPGGLAEAVEDCAAVSSVLGSWWALAERSPWFQAKTAWYQPFSVNKNVSHESKSTFDIHRTSTRHLRFPCKLSLASSFCGEADPSQCATGMFWVLVFMIMTLYSVAILCTRVIGHGSIIGEDADEDLQKIKARCTRNADLCSFYR